MQIVLSASGTNPPVLCASFICMAHAFDHDKDVQTEESTYSFRCRVFVDPSMTGESTSVYKKSTDHKQKSLYTTLTAPDPDGIVHWSF